MLFTVLFGHRSEEAEENNDQIGRQRQRQQHPQRIGGDGRDAGKIGQRRDAAADQQQAGSGKAGAQTAAAGHAREDGGAVIAAEEGKEGERQKEHRKGGGAAGFGGAAQSLTLHVKIGCSGKQTDADTPAARFQTLCQTEAGRFLPEDRGGCVAQEHQRHGKEQGGEHQQMQRFKEGEPINGKAEQEGGKECAELQQLMMQRLAQIVASRADLGEHLGQPVGRKGEGEIGGCGGLVVSGMASGVDTAAMLGALAAEVSSVGVLGCGGDVIYAKENRPLYDKTIQNGCLLSEYIPGTKPSAWNFPARNRIISGISNGVLVVEAPMKSGALITARNAMEQGRDVFAVPGNLGVETCEGSNALLQDGAITALSGWDVIKVYQPAYADRVKKWQPSAEQLRELDAQTLAMTGEAPGIVRPINTATDKKDVDKEEKSSYIVLDDVLSTLEPEEQAVVAVLTTRPQEVDGLLDRIELPAAKVLNILTKLSLKGIVKQHPGKRVSL